MIDVKKSVSWLFGSFKAAEVKKDGEQVICVEDSRQPGVIVCLTWEEQLALIEIFNDANNW